MTAVTKPKALKQGSKVALLAPSSRPPSLVEVNRCKAMVEKMGFNAVVGKHVLDAHGYMAGTDTARLADLNEAIEDDSVEGIFMLCGGYGALRLLPDINYRHLSRNPKVIVGSGDCTAILLAVHKMTKGMVVFYGPNLDDVVDKRGFEILKGAVLNEAHLPSIDPNSDFNSAEHHLKSYCHASVPEDVEGVLSGGNLTSLVSLMGTPYQIETEGKLLFLNDNKERNDILDRWFTNLTVCGAMKAAAAVIYGEFHDCYQRGAYSLHSIFELIVERMERLQSPYAVGFPMGEGGRPSVLPIGIKARLERENARLTFLEAAVEAN